MVINHTHTKVNERPLTGESRIIRNLKVASNCIGSYSPGMNKPMRGTTAKGAMRMVPTKVIDPDTAPARVVYSIDGALVPLAPLDPDMPPQVSGTAIVLDHKRRLPNGLTTQADVFCRCVARGIPLNDAYRAAYGDKTTPVRTAWRVQVLLRMDRIKAAIQVYKAELMREGAQAPLTMRNFVTGRLVHESQTAKNDGTRVRALELLGKTQSMFTDVKRVETITSGDIDKLKAQLSQRLSDVVARFVTSASPSKGDETERSFTRPHPTGSPPFSSEGPVENSHIKSAERSAVLGNSPDGTHPSGSMPVEAVFSPVGVFSGVGGAHHREMSEDDL